MLNIGLLGAGRIGAVHARTIASHPGSRLVSISDVVQENAQKLATDYQAKVESSDKILADPAIDAVLIASSTDTHSDFIEAATAAGKWVLCEKPVDLSLARAQACRQKVAEAGKSVMIGFNRRFDPSFRALKEAAGRGEIGKTELLSVTSFDPQPPPVSYIKVSGGLFRDMMIHDFDLTHYIMGAVPVRVFAAASTLVDPDIAKAGDVDTAIVTLTYEDGRLAVIRNSRRAAYGYDQRLELLGSKGLLQAENMSENTLVKSTVDGITGAKPPYFFLERYMAAYAAEWAAFVDAITQGKDFPVTLDDGVMALAIAEAATKSAKSGEPVELSDIIG